MAGSGRPERTVASLYRRLIRVAIRMPDRHRMRFVGARVRQEVEQLAATPAGDSFRQKSAELEVYLDNLHHQAAHLGRLARLKPSQLLVPIDLRSPPTPSATQSRVLWAVHGSQTTPPSAAERFMNGPEPSWVIRRRTRLTNDRTSNDK